MIYDTAVYGGRAAYFKSNIMEGKVTIFPSGKMISVGTKSLDRAKKELTLVAMTLEINLKTQIKIQNIVAKSDLGFKADLEQIRFPNEINVSYEPESFPGMIIRMPLSENIDVAVFNLFSSGKLICLGLKSIEDVQKAIDHIFEYIRKWKR